MLVTTVILAASPCFAGRSFKHAKRGRKRYSLDYCRLAKVLILIWAYFWKILVSSEGLREPKSELQSDVDDYENDFK